MPFPLLAAPEVGHVSRGKLTAERMLVTDEVRAAHPEFVACPRQEIFERHRLGLDRHARGGLEARERHRLESRLPRLAQPHQHEAEAQAALNRVGDALHQGFEVAIRVDLGHHAQDGVQAPGALAVLVELGEVELAEPFLGALELGDALLEPRIGRLDRLRRRRGDRLGFLELPQLAARAVELGAQSHLDITRTHLAAPWIHAATRSAPTTRTNASTTSGSN